MRRENVLIANRPSVRGSATHHRCPVTKPSSEHSQNVVAFMQVAGSLTSKRIEDGASNGVQLQRLQGLVSLKLNTVRCQTLP